MDYSLSALLSDELAQYQITAADEQLRGILRHLEMVAEWNEHLNLTAITDDREMIVKHAVDSALVLLVTELAPGLKVLDVGTGAGFPGVTLKCLMPGVDLTLLETLAKKCKFLEAVKADLFAGAQGAGADCSIVWGRAEEKGQEKGYREQFDLVVARAVAQLRVLAEYTLPFCRVGGTVVALKGPAAEAEVADAADAIKILGGRLEEVRSVELPLGAGSRTLIRMKKVAATPAKYPRKAGTPLKSPL
ncbi:MAG: 16S rRNA (guanine(527)-N(7))-methyltransferase RsmG [Mycobacterium leprae]